MNHVTHTHADSAGVELLFAPPATYSLVTLCIRMRHVTHTHVDSAGAKLLLASLTVRATSISAVAPAHTNESRYTFERVMLHTQTPIPQAPKYS